MADEFEVDPPALERFAGRSADRERQFTSLRSEMDAVHLDRDAFGHIPGIGDRIYSAYQEFVDGCESATTEMASSMGWIALGVRGTAQAYEGSDHHAADRVNQAGGN